MRLLKVFFILVTITAVLFTFSCKKSSAKELVLKIGTNAEYPPFEYKENGEFMGVDIALVKLVAQKMGAKAEIVDMDFDSLIPSLVSNKIDMAIAAMTITDARKEQVNFSIPYYTANQAIIVPQASTITIAATDDLAKYKVGCQNGTTGQIYMDDNFVKTGKMDKDKLRKYSTNIEAITDLLNGNVDIVIIDDSAANGYSKLKPLNIIHKIETGENYGIAFNKVSKNKEQVDKILQEILQSDEWLEIIKKYL